MIHWPAIIKYADDAELIYVSSQAQWDEDTDLHLFDYDASDYLIDSVGDLYRLTMKTAAGIQAEHSGETIALYDLLGLVKAHAAMKGSCCVSKLYAPSIVEAFKIVQSLDHD